MVSGIECLTRQEIERDARDAWAMATRVAGGVHSFVVDVREVLGPAGAATYLARYLVEHEMVREKMVEKGFVRRWSRSRNWPGDERLVLKGTAENAWVQVEVMPKSKARSRVQKEAMARAERSPLCKWSGDRASVERAMEKRKRMGAAGLVEVVKNASVRA